MLNESVPMTDSHGVDYEIKAECYMRDKAQQVLGGIISFLMLLTSSIVPSNAAQTPNLSDAIRSEAGSAPTRIVADGLSDADSQVFERFSESLEQYRKQLNIPGMSAAVVRGGQLAWAEGFGFADVENEIAATPETPYHLASLTKTFASQIIMKLVEEGKIDLEDPVRKSGVKIPDDPGIKIKHLLTHTSEGRPGSYYKYNGYRFGFIGKVVEKATGRTFRELVISQILEPTDMNNTAPVLPRSKVKKFKAARTPKSMEDNFKHINKKLAKPYALNDSFEIVPNEYPKHFGVSTGLISNVIDMAKYDKAIDDNAFISKQTQELAWTPATSNSRKTLPYGLGWFVQHFAGTKLLWHYGWEVSYSALILKVPQEDITFIVFANTDCLSRPFRLGAGDVLNSPFAVEFLKTIVFKDRFSEPPPQIDWQSDAEDIVSHFEQAKDADLKELLRRELVSNLNINRHLGGEENAKKLMDVYIQLFTQDEFADFGELPVIASIDNVTDDQYEMMEFELEDDTPVRVYAAGEGSGNVMFDYGGIENANTGQLVWEMYAIFAEHAGGASKNCKVDRVIPLPAGTYRLHYRTDESHSFDNWNDLPPDHCWWGIRLFDVTAATDYAAPDFLEKAAPEALGWSSEKLEALGSELEKRKSAALMIVTDGKVVFEWGKTANNIFSHSARKSLLSALYGIYVADGKIDTSMTLEQLGIKERIPLTEFERKAKVIDLLKARSGVYIPAAAEAKSMRDARPKRGSHSPGTHWYYNNWDFNVLGTIFKQQTGEGIYEAFKKRIADPIGMQDFILEKQQYSYEENFSIHPAYPFLISARDMARFGQLFLQQGKWNGEQIIPSDWVKDSIRSYSDTGKPATGYGFMWWIITDDFYGMKAGDYYASGYGGQKIFVLPRINTVVVHRINIYVPGIDIQAASGAPFQLMPKIMEAYTAQKKQAPPVVARTIMLPEHLLIDYAALQEVEPKNYRKFRMALWLCVVVFGSAVLIWPLLFSVRRLRKIQPSNALRKRSKLPTAAKFVVCLIALFSIIYLLGVLLIPGALEFIAVNGLPPSLPLFWSIISYTPWLCTVVMAPILILNIFAWIRKYWTIAERFHFSLVSITLIIFIWLSFILNIVPGLS